MQKVGITLFIVCCFLAASVVIPIAQAQETAGSFVQRQKTAYAKERFSKALQTAISANESSRISNGLLEGMNSLIQAAKARSRGFRNANNLITMIYLIGGKLTFPLLDAFSYTHTK